jgi:hypothetical protein
VHVGSVAKIVTIEIYEASLNTYVVFEGQNTQTPTVIINQVVTERKLSVIFNDNN